MSTSFEALVLSSKGSYAERKSQTCLLPDVVLHSRDRTHTQRPLFDASALRASKSRRHAIILPSTSAGLSELSPWSQDEADEWSDPDEKEMLSEKVSSEDMDIAKTSHSPNPRSRTQAVPTSGTIKLKTFLSWLEASCPSHHTLDLGPNRDSFTSIRSVYRPFSCHIRQDGFEEVVRRCRPFLFMLPFLTLSQLDEIAALDPIMFMNQDGSCFCPRAGCRDVLNNLGGLRAHLHLHNICNPCV